MKEGKGEKHNSEENKLPSNLDITTQKPTKRTRFLPILI